MRACSSRYSKACNFNNGHDIFLIHPPRKVLGHEMRCVWQKISDSPHKILKIVRAGYSKAAAMPPIKNDISVVTIVQLL